MLTFEEHMKPKIISFDFDGTIAAHDWNEEDNDYERDEKTGWILEHPNKEIIKKLIEYKLDGNTVYIVTSRGVKWKGDTLKFLKDHNIFRYIDDVYFTNGRDKVETLEKLKVNKHYDDDQHELDALKGTNIEGVLV